MPEYALLVRHREANWESKGEDEKRRILKLYDFWMDELTNRGAYRGAKSLKDGGRTVRKREGNLVDGPFAETKEIVGGFVLVEAANYDEACQLAGISPALSLGDWIEVREVSVFEQT